MLNLIDVKVNKNMVETKKNSHFLGFTLVEIMIVVAIIAMLAAIAIPNLLRVRLDANEAAAEAALRTINTSAQSYRAMNPTFPASLGPLASAVPPYIDAVLGAGAKSGYNFLITGNTNTFTATARPQGYGVSGKRSFYVDENGVIRYTAEDREPTSADPPITP
jgi:prepilin-type N-terminal cleavage/methylation domain-containing protein